MPRREKKYHYLYKTTNLKNGKFYVGIHSTDNLEDGYLGSGKYLWNSIYKYGKEHFEREILELFETREKLFEREKNLVNEDFIKDPMCMNLRIGGEGGLAVNNDGWLNARKKLDELRNNKTWVEFYSKQISESRIKSYKNGTNVFTPLNWTGLKHKEETIKKMQKSKIGHGIGEKNSQFGTCWISKESINKKIKIEELSLYLSSGWIKGRKMGK